MNFYAMPSFQPLLRQGDVVGPIPFPMINPFAANIIGPRTQDGSMLMDLTTVQPEPGSAILLPFKSFMAIVVTQCRDLNGKSPFVLARVSLLQEVYKAYKVGMGAKQRVDAIKVLANAGKTPSHFYLPPSGDEFPASAAELAVTVTLSPDAAGPRLKTLRLRLSDPARLAFQNRLCYSLGRYAAPDDLYYDAEEWQHVERGKTARQQNIP